MAQQIAELERTGALKRTTQPINKMNTYIYNVELDACGTHNGDIAQGMLQIQVEAEDPQEGESNAHELLREMSREVELYAVLNSDGEGIDIDEDGNEIVHEEHTTNK